MGGHGMKYINPVVYIFWFFYFSFVLFHFVYFKIGGNMGSTKSNGKGFSMTSRHPDRSEEGRSPGPLRYKHEASMRTTGSPNPAAYSFGGRNTREGRNENPGPGSYSPEKPLGTFEFVSGRRNPIGTKLGLKHEHLVAKSGRNPGPGSYDPVSTDLFKQKAPAYSVTPKTYT